MKSVNLLIIYAASATAFVAPARQRCSSCHKSNRPARTLILFGLVTADEENMQQEDSSASSQRRNLLLSLPFLTTYSIAHNAQARGLVMFPCEKGELLNTYHFMRAGESLLEAEDIWSTNPLFLTNREDALSIKGQEQVTLACQAIKDLRKIPTIVKHSLAASCIDSADIVARELKLGRDRIIPEFTFMDPRAIGGWDMTRKSETVPAVWAMDVLEAGESGVDGRPPPNEDGTPHETLADQAVRLRQVMSVLESLYSGDTILLIFPDGTSPALLSAMIAGVPYNRCHELEFEPGEIRLDVSMDQTLTLLQSNMNSEARKAYQATIDKGKKTLVDLRAGNVVNVKEKNMEAERVIIEKEFQEKQERQNVANEQKQLVQASRQRELYDLQKETASNPQKMVAAVGILGIVGTALASAPKRLSSEALEGKNDDNESSVVEQPGTLGMEASQQATGIPSSTLYGTPLQITSPEDRQLIAQNAMQEYLDQDDGGDAWLQSVVEIMDEPEEEEHLNGLNGLRSPG